MKQNFKPELIVDTILEAKIKYLSYLYPNNEWSGILFVEYKGSFKNKDLKIIARDLYLMDIGSSTLTEYSSGNAEYFKYAAENNLLDCDFGVIHTHHNMNAFFSLTDSQELEKTGKEREVYVSLIVNNKGEYVARITQRVKRKSIVNWSLEIQDIDDITNSNTQEVIEENILNIFDCIVKTPQINKIIDSQVNKINKEKKPPLIEIHKENTFTKHIIKNTSPDLFEDTTKYSEIEDDSTYYKEIHSVAEDIIVETLGFPGEYLETAIENLSKDLKFGKDIDKELLYDVFIDSMYAYVPDLEANYIGKNVEEDITLYIKHLVDTSLEKTGFEVFKIIKSFYE